MSKKLPKTPWYERASSYWPWFVAKEINIIQFSEYADDGGHNQFAARLTFKCLGFKVGKEFLLIVNHQSPSWGLDWVEYDQKSGPEWRCIHYKEQVDAAITRWFEMIESNKEWAKKQRRKELDRGQIVSKYEG